MDFVAFSVLAGSTMLTPALAKDDDVALARVM
jgi:hypothetical protein